jgi:hypothetical protein
VQVQHIYNLLIPITYPHHLNNTCFSTLYSKSQNQGVTNNIESFPRDFVHLILIVNKGLNLKEPNEYIIIANFMKNMYPPNVQIREHNEQIDERELHREIQQEL